MQKEQGNLVTPFVGAQTSLYCSLAPELMGSKYNGLYFDDCKVKESTFVDNAENADKAKNLWDVSVELTNSDLPTCWKVLMSVALEILQYFLTWK